MGVVTPAGEGPDGIEEEVAEARVGSEGDDIDAAVVEVVVVAAVAEDEGGGEAGEAGCALGAEGIIALFCSQSPFL